MVYSHTDRIIVIGMMPIKLELKLEAGKELAADYFLERRELGCINIGGKGIITVDGTEYEMNPRDGMYIGMGNKEITFRSCDENAPAKFYVSSCPAHTSYPIVKIDITKATHQDYFCAISNYLSKTYLLQTDKSGKDISRACFLPHDSSCIINPKFLRK